MKEPPSKFWRFIRAMIFYPACSALLAWPLGSFVHLPFIFGWFIVINLFGFIAIAKDKIATQFEWQFTLRTQLSVIYLIGFIGGFPGIFIGQHVFNHRTQEKLLTTCMWVLFLIQISLAFLSVTERFKEVIDHTFSSSKGQTAAEYFKFSDGVKKPQSKSTTKQKAPATTPREKTAAEMFFGK